MRRVLVRIARGVGLLSGVTLTVVAMGLGLLGLQWLRSGWGCRASLSPEVRVQAVTLATDQFVITHDRCPDDTDELVKRGFLSAYIVREFPIAIVCVRSGEPAEASLRPSVTKESGAGLLHSVSPLDSAMLDAQDAL